jgi:hypothetical protein
VSGRFKNASLKWEAKSNSVGSSSELLLCEDDPSLFDEELRSSSLLTGGSFDEL